MESTTSPRIVRILTMVFGILFPPLSTELGAQIAGPNHDVLAGPVAPGDPEAFLKIDVFRQRENEPVVAVSSVHPEHLLVAANDYRTIDVAEDFGLGESDGSILSSIANLFKGAGRLLARLVGWSPPEPSKAPIANHPEAWMGVYRSCDRGRTWFSGLLPGSPHDLSPASLGSPLRGLDAASDPVLATGRNGHVYLGGMAFHRTGTTKIFAVRYTDRTDREGGVCFDYDFARVVEEGSATSTGKFADKPTIMADPFGNVYLAYTVFTGLEVGGNFRSRIRFFRSTDDGVTWSSAQNISRSFNHGQGAALAVDPRNGALYAVWRDFVDNKILFVKSTDFGQSFSVPRPVHPLAIQPFDQPAVITDPPCPTNDAGCQFRSNGFPTIAVANDGTVLVAWQERVNPSTGLPAADGTPRAVLTRSANGGGTWAARRAADFGPRSETDPSTGEPVDRPSGPQVMPALSCSAGHCMLLYYEALEPLGTPFPVTSFITGIERQMDVRVAELAPADGSLLRPSIQVSQYRLEAGTNPPQITEAAPGFERVHRPNLPLFVAGRVASTGDYNGLAPVIPLSRQGNTWQWAGELDVPRPTFLGVWTSNENVDFPGGDIGGDWTSYTAPGSGAPSCLDPGSRDQDVFLSEIGLDGIVASSPNVFKPLLEPDGEPIPRAFVVSVENRTGQSRRVDLELFPRDPNTQPTFDRQDLSFTSIEDLEILPFSTTTQTVVLFSTARDGSARVDVRDADILARPLLSRVLLNANPVAFALTNTGIADSEIHTPKISSLRFFRHEGFGSPRFSNHSPSSPRFSNPRFSNPSLPETSIEEVDATFTVINDGNTTSAYDLLVNLAGGQELIDTGKFTFQLLVYRTATAPGSEECLPVEVLTDTVITTIADPRFSNPRFSNREYEDPRFSNPRFSNPRFSNATFSVAPAEGVIGEEFHDASLHSQLSVPALTAAQGVPPELVGLRPDQVHVTVRVFRTAEPTPGDPVEDIDLLAFVQDRAGIAVVAEVPDFENGDFGELSFDVSGNAPPTLPFTVTNTNDSGAGSLRQAILDANTDTGLNTIMFQIPGAGPHTIELLSELPTITDPVVIDGTTQPGYAGAPVIELTGIPGLGRGLRILAGGSTVRALAISQFPVAAIELAGGGNVIQANFIGTDVSGTLARPNGNGIMITGSPNNLIGGTAPSERNVISANAGGIQISSPGATGNQVVGNFIGTNASGTAALGNDFWGVVISDAPGNIVGGLTPGSGNVISANGSHGIQLSGASATGNQIVGNRIGTDLSGTVPLGNAFAGIFLSDAPNNTIGGTGSSAGNVISGNGQYGILIQLTGATGNEILGNRIGTTSDGTSALANGNGVVVFSSSSNIIGGTTPAARNVISGNSGLGVWLDSLTTGNLLQGNFIGTNAAGTAALGNGVHGVVVSAPNNSIGGTSAGSGNVISGNGFTGIVISGTDASGNLVQGNFIGTDAAGTAAVPNFTGMLITSSAQSNTIGGTTVGARNVISGNAQSGVSIGGDASSNQVLGNFIGTNQDGTAALGNGFRGVVIDGAPNNTVGGTVAGAGNVISGNAFGGVDISGPTATGNAVRKNFIGTDASGGAALGNGTGAGVQINDAPINTIGGSTDSRNLISGNAFVGIAILGANATSNVIAANTIGTNFDGSGPVPNGHGVLILSSVNTIGSDFPGLGNLISGNTGQGVWLTGSGAIGNIVLGNLIGTNAGGTATLGNGGNGVLIDANATTNTIGGSPAATRNVISGNGLNGVRIDGGGNTVRGNYIGTDVNGTGPIGNTLAGVSIESGTGFNALGGTPTGTEPNRIAFNGGPGIRVAAGAGSGNWLRFNELHTNAGLGIDLGGDGVTLNDSGDGDSGPNDLQNFPVLILATSGGGTTTVQGSLNSTPSTLFAIDFFYSSACDPSGNGEGATVLGSDIQSTDGSGNVSFTSIFGTGLAPGTFVTATATSPGISTSEFSVCVTVP